MTRTRMLEAGRADGFTLVEMLIVVAILGILTTLAAPAYLSARDRATSTTAKANIRALSLAAEMYSLDNVGDKNDVDGKKNTTGYKGMTIGLLRDNYDASLSGDLSFKGNPKAESYCAVFSSGAVSWSATGPGIDGESFVNNAKCK